MVYEQRKFKQLTNNYPQLKNQLIEWFKANETICQLSNSEPEQTNNSYITHAIITDLGYLPETSA